MRAILLAAGQGYKLGGFNKLLIKHPLTRRTILDHVLDAFRGKEITVVLGYRAIEVMHEYPQLDYVINDDWAVSGNALSLGLALDHRPCYVVSGDIFFDQSLVTYLDAGPDDLVLTDARENRILSAVHCQLDSSRRVLDMYQGPVQDASHPEAIGLFKISDVTTLRRWRERCREYGNLFVGQTLPCDQARILSVDRAGHEFVEINTAEDYARLSSRVAVA